MTFIEDISQFMEKEIPLNKNLRIKNFYGGDGTDAFVCNIGPHSNNPFT